MSLPGRIETEEPAVCRRTRGGTTPAHWPTYYPANLSAGQIVDEMLAH
ncbi:MAG: ZinT/AdcA family metal-binding protein [Rhizobiaceae bacterium]|nr:ZinT/AdcA family metal-binding protein [Rhizobiaceae bacterium]